MSILILFLISMNSCLYDKVNPAEYTKSNPTCSDSMQYTYNLQIRPIIKAYCYDCHSTAVTQDGGLDLENYVTLKEYMAIDFQGDQVFGSMFYHCLLKSIGSKPMPPSNLTVSDCEITKIKKWIEAGAPND